MPTAMWRLCAAVGEARCEKIHTHEGTAAAGKVLVLVLVLVYQLHTPHTCLLLSLDCLPFRRVAWRRLALALPWLASLASP